MFKEMKWNWSVIFRIPVLAYLLMSVITIIFSSPERNYFDLSLINTNELVMQLVGLIGISGLLFLFRGGLSKDIMSVSICFLMLLFVLLFAINAPALSLLIGASVIAIPPTYFSLYRLLKKHEKFLNFTNIVSLVNVGVFLAIVLLLVTNLHTVFPELPDVNQSRISHESFIYGNRIDFLKSGIYIFILFILVFIFNQENDVLKRYKHVKYILFAVIGALCAYEIIYMVIVEINRVRSIYTPTYDFGIFSQMYYNILDGAGPVTTLERSELLSHFAVHMSPILYVLVPIFAVFPYPETIQALQIIVVGIGLVPLYLISKELKLSHIITAFLMIVYIFHPAIVSSSFYDFHENCFLAPMLLFVIYFLMKQKWLGILISVVLTLMIKEDAGVYLVFISLYFIFGYPSIMAKDKNKLFNILVPIGIILVSMVYFYLVTGYLNSDGEGAMFWRYDNLNAYEDKGVLGILFSVFQNPSFLLATMFSPEKIYTILIIFLFMGGIPLLSRNFSDYWLIVPLVILNLASTYLYQHMFGYQYFYGTGTLLVFMMAVTLKQRMDDKPIKLQMWELNTILYVGLIAAIAFFGIMFLDTKSYVNANYRDNLERNIETKAFLTSIDEEKKVLATGYMTTYLSDVDVIYDIQYYHLNGSEIVFDYIILDLRANPDKIIDYSLLALANGYVQSDLSNEYILVYVPAQ